MTPELSRPFALDRLGAAGTAVTVEASAAELPAIAARLLIPAIGALSCRFRLRRIEGPVIEALGMLQAEVVQVCVVSLDEFTQRVEEPFTVHFVPEGTEEDDPDPDSIDQVTYTGSALDLGEALVVQLALTLDPYPRQPDAAIPGDARDAGQHPFAALAAMRTKQ